MKLPTLVSAALYCFSALLPTVLFIQQVAAERQEEVYRARPAIQQKHLLAGEHYRNGRDTEALQLWLEVAAEEPEHTEAWRNAVILLGASGKLVQALSTLRTAVRSNPESVELNSMLSNALLKRGKVREADKITQKLAHENPYSVEAQFARALFCFERQNFSCAARGWKKVLELAPEKPPKGTRFNLGLAFLGLQDFGSALIHFERDAELQPLNSESVAKVGLCYASLGKTEKAIEWYKKALSIDPDISWPNYNLGTLYYELGRNEEAVKHLQRQLDLTPQYPDALSNLGLAYIELTEFGKALAAFRAAIKLNSQAAHYHYNEGIALEHLTCEKTALASYRKALSLAPKFSLAKKKVAKLGAEARDDKDCRLLDDASSGA